MPAYRPEIDGLRCLAVVPVLFFHADLPPFSGGFVGVDVFFVISGYLITSILVAEMRDGSFSFARFYERRARRILPAMFFVMLATLPFGWHWLMVREFKELLQSVAAAALSVSNVYFWLKSDYFAQAAELLPLLHTWSLAVEEQFYIVFPAILLLIWRRKPGWAVPVVSAIALLSFAAGLYFIRDYPMMVYFLLPFRAWELMAGALCAIVHLDRGRRTHGGAALAGVAAILIAMVAYDHATVFPGWAALLPVAGTVLIILYADPETLVGRVLAWRPVVFVGLVSYSLYLWHQPVLAFARHYAPDPLTTPAALALLALSFGLAVFSWRYVELPFRGRGPDAFVPRRRAVFGLSIAGIVAFTAAGVLGDRTNGFPGRLGPEETRIARANGWSSACMFTRANPAPAFPIDDCVTSPGQDKTVALFGDSVMSSLSPVLTDFFVQRGYEVHQITHSHCTLNTAYRRTGANASPCPAFARNAIDFIRQKDFDLVVHAGNFVPFFAGEPGEITRADGTPSQDTEAALADFRANAGDLPQRLVLLLPHQVPPVDVRLRALKQMRTTGEIADYTLPRTALDPRPSLVRDRLAKIAEDHWLVLETDEALCDAAQCSFVKDGSIRLSDVLHFTSDGARRVARRLEALLVSEGLMQAARFDAENPTAAPRAASIAASGSLLHLP